MRFVGSFSLERRSDFFLVESYQCPRGQSEKTITVNDEAELTFLAEKPPHNMDCRANYVMGTCARVELQCDFTMNAKDKIVFTLGTNTIT